MKSYTVHVFATAQVTAKNEEEARKCLEALSHNGSITLTACRPERWNPANPEQPYVFVCATINEKAELKYACEV